MPRRRTYTEMLGCHVSRHDYLILKAELKRRKLTVADYLRAVAIKPLVDAQAELIERADPRPFGDD